jgi:hypothetical protein
MIHFAFSIQYIIAGCAFLAQGLTALYALVDLASIHGRCLHGATRKRVLVHSGEEFVLFFHGAADLIDYFDYSGGRGGSISRTHVAEVGHACTQLESHFFSHPPSLTLTQENILISNSPT